MKNISYGILLLIFLIAFLPRAAFAGFILKSNEGDASMFMQDDSSRYYKIALNLLREDFDFKQNSRLARFGILWDVPLYPVFLLTFFKVSGPSYLLAVFLNIILFSLSVCVLYILGVFLFGNKTALCAAVVYSFYPSLVMYSLYPMTEPLLLLLFLSAFCGFTVFLKSRKIRYLVLAAVFFGLSTLTKETVAFIPLIPAFFVLLKYGIGRKQAVIPVFLLLAVYTAVLSPVLIFNYRNSGFFTLSAKTVAEARYLRYRLSNFKKQQDAVIFDDKIGSAIYGFFYKRRQLFAGTGTIGMLRALKYDVSGLESATEQPGLFFRELKKLGRGWAIYQFFAWIFTGVVYAASFWALILLVRRKRIKEVICFFAILFYFLAAYFFQYSTRYFIPVVPFLSLLCAYFLANIKNYILTKTGN